MNDIDMEKLEYLVDEYFLPEIVTSLSKICQFKADDLKGQDKDTSRKFELYSSILINAREQIDNVL
jgi:hypothetical protein